MKALMKQLVRLHYCEWGVGDDHPPPPKQLTNFSHLYSHSVLLSFCIACWCLMQGKWHSQPLEKMTHVLAILIFLGKLTSNTSSPFLAKRTSVHSATSKTGKKAIPVGSLNLCSMVLPPSRLKMTTVLFSQSVMQTCFLSLTREALNGRPISWSTRRKFCYLTNKIYQCQGYHKWEDAAGAFLEWRWHLSGS